MEQKPPRPRTLNISPPANKKCVRPSRQRRHGGSRNASELRMLANNIKEIIHDLSFQPTSEDSREKVSRRYIGISRSATYENQPRFSRRNIVSAYYDENRDGSAITRESGMHLMDRVTTTDRYNRGEPEDKATKRQSCPWDLSYFGQHEDRSLQILASELHHLREVREKEVTDLLKVNNKLQHNLFEADREISTLQQKSDTNEKRLDAMLNVYEKIRGNLKMCLGKVRDLEVIGSRFSTPINSDDESRSQRTDGGDASSGFNTMSSDISECLSLGATALGYEGKGDGEGSVCEKTRRNFLNGNDAGKDIDSISIDSRSTGPRDPSPPNNQSGGTNGSSPSPDRQLLGRLQADVDSLSQVNSDQSQEIERLRLDLSSCRKHVMSTQYQLEAVEIECSRLLAMEDQLVSVITLLRRARQMHIHRQILGDVVLSAVVTSDTDDEDAGRSLFVL
ncbi:hypothetical protein FSP39_019486 [Pinctada imbricata]|uniref:Uncharacterized protein n=1 Tax=Pinctada imbricata TaxID=66713 RepID=A0AA89CB98_PINIB|nr:hypothetical protein FSP39_019486 [Pinctada imbricata]